jgi:hypothetical protein
MGFLDTLFGRTRTRSARVDALFRLSTAEPDLEDKLQVRYGGRLAVVLRDMEASRFAKVLQEARDILGRSSNDLPVTVAEATDNLHFHWLIVKGKDLTAALTGAHLVEQLAEEGGFSDALLAAIADFDQFCLVYSYRHGHFYPFCQTGPNRRDQSREIRVSAVLNPLLPMEPDPGQWYPLWDPPWDAPA